MKRVTLFSIALVLGYGSLLFARSLGQVSIEGVGQKKAKEIKEIVMPILKDSFSYDSVEDAIDEIYQTGSFNDIEVYYDENGSKTDVTFKITQIKIVKSITFHGNRTFSNSELMAELGISENEGYSSERVKAGVEAVKKFYNLNGFLNAQVSADFQLMENKSDVAGSISIDEGNPCLIESIKFQSVNKDLNRSLEKKFYGNIKRSFTQSLLTGMQSDASEFLFKERYLSAALASPEITYDPRKENVNLKYVVDDPYLYALVFEGNDTYSAAKILKELRLDSGARLSSSPVEDLTERTIKFYKKSGYPSVTVKHRENLFVKEYERRIIFNINEGNRVKIKDIIIDGIYSRPAKFYRNFLYEHSGDLVDSKYFNSGDIDDGIKNLVTELQNQGFIGAKVRGTRVDFDSRREFVIIKVSLDEGPQTLVDKIAFTGIKNVTIKELEEVIGLNEKAPLRLNNVEESVTHILDLYRSKGFLDAKVLNQGKSIINYSPDYTRAVLTFKISEGHLITVGSIVIEGNTFTKDYVILRELQFKVGEVLTPEKIGYSESRLQRLSIFSGVDIRPLDDDAEQGKRTVLVHVSEHDPGIFKSGVGINSELDLTLKGFVGAAYRNLWGTGRAINARVELNDKVKIDFREFTINGGYTEPFIFETTNTGRFNISTSRKLFAIVATPTQKIYAQDKTQTDLLLERDFTRYLKVIVEVYGITHSNRFEIHDQDVSKPLDIATVGPTFLYDKRDSPFNPTRGHITTLSFEYSDPLLGSTKTVNYYKTVSSHTRYFPFGPVVWANEVKAGYLKNLSFLSDGAVPPENAFVLGGRSTIRGFEPFSESIPRLADYPDGIRIDSYFALAKTEMRFPLYGNFGGAAFYDGGKVQISGQKGLPETDSHGFGWRDSAGVGIRYNTPVGPLSIDVAYKLNRDDTPSHKEDAIYYHFSIGVF